MGKTPSSIGGFEIVSRLGEGGMGVVYKAKQVSLDRVVALKVLPDHLAVDGDYVERFLREARACGKLNHENIVRGIDSGKDGGFLFIAMEFVEGETTEQRLRDQGRFPEKEMLRVALAVARALEHAHRHGLVHRDIKPANILIRKDGMIKVADMGLAYPTQDNPGLTAIGLVVGTPDYISPEQAQGKRDLDFRADVYALGATLYHLVTGVPPFRGGDPATVMTMHLSAPLIPPRQKCPELSAESSALIERMMAKKPADRFSSPAELCAEIGKVIAGAASAPTPAPGPAAPVRVKKSPSTQRRAQTRTRRHVVGRKGSPTGVIVGVAVAAVVVIGLLIALASSSGPPPPPPKTVEEASKPPKQPEQNVVSLPPAKTSENLPEKPPEKTSEKPAEKTSEKPGEKPPENPPEKAPEEPVEKIVPVSTLFGDRPLVWKVGAELLLHGGFEDPEIPAGPCVYWIYACGGPHPELFRRDTSTVRGGQASLRLTAPRKPGDMCPHPLSIAYADVSVWSATEYCCVRPGRPYRLSCWIRPEGGADISSWGDIRCGWMTGNVLKFYQMRSAVHPPSSEAGGDWTCVVREGCAPDGSSRAAVHVRPGLKSGSLFIDDVQMNELILSSCEIVKELGAEEKLPGRHIERYHAFASHLEWYLWMREYGMAYMEAEKLLNEVKGTPLEKEALRDREITRRLDAFFKTVERVGRSLKDRTVTACGFTSRMIGVDQHGRMILKQPGQAEDFLAGFRNLRSDEMVAFYRMEDPGSDAGKRALFFFHAAEAEPEKALALADSVLSDELSLYWRARLAGLKSPRPPLAGEPGEKILPEEPKPDDSPPASELLGDLPPEWVEGPDLLHGRGDFEVDDKEELFRGKQLWRTVCGGLHLDAVDIDTRRKSRGGKASLRLTALTRAYGPSPCTHQIPKELPDMTLMCATEYLVLRPGRPYRLAASRYGTRTAADWDGLIVSWMDCDRHVSMGMELPPRMRKLSGGWTRIEHEGVAPDGGTRAVVNLRLGMDSGTVNLDDVRFTELVLSSIPALKTVASKEKIPASDLKRYEDFAARFEVLLWTREYRAARELAEKFVLEVTGTRVEREAFLDAYAAEQLEEYLETCRRAALKMKGQTLKACGLKGNVTEISPPVDFLIEAKTGGTQVRLACMKNSELDDLHDRESTDKAGTDYGRFFLELMEGNRGRVEKMAADVPSGRLSLYFRARAACLRGPVPRLGGEKPRASSSQGRAEKILDEAEKLARRGTRYFPQAWEKYLEYEALRDSDDKRAQKSRAKDLRAFLGGELVLYASQAARGVRGDWRYVDGADAAEGKWLVTPDPGSDKDQNLPDPSDYIDFPEFFAPADVEYAVWVRIKPGREGDPKNHDSVCVQFSDSIDDEGDPDYRIGTKEALHANLLMGSGAKRVGWAAANEPGDALTKVSFQKTGMHRMRVVIRERGASFDQVVISSDKNFKVEDRPADDEIVKPPELK